MKKGIKTLGIFIGIFFVLWAIIVALQIILPLVGVDNEAIAVKNFLNIRLQTFLSFITFKATDPKDLIYTISMVSVLGLALIMIIILIIVAAVKKRPAYIWFSLLLLVMAVPSAEAVLEVRDMLTAGMNYLLTGLMALGALIAIFTFILWILVLAQISRSRRLELEGDEEDPEAVLAEPAEFFVSEELANEPVPEYVPEAEPEVEPAEVERERKDQGNLSNRDLAELIRDIVRDEMSRRDARQETHTNSDNQTITGATFGGPLIVQYFNGMAAPTPAPAPAPQPQPQPQPEPKAEPQPAPAPVEEEQPVEEPAPVEEEPAPQPEPTPAPVVEEPQPAEAVVEQPEKNPIIRIPFRERIVDAEKEMQDDYNEIKNELLSWGLKSRVSSSGDTFRLHRKTYVKLTIAGKSLKLYFALDPEDYKDSKIPVQDAGHKGIYAEIPLVFKVKSELSMRRCKQLIQDVCERDGLEQGQVESINWVKEIKAELKEAKKAAKDED